MGGRYMSEKRNTPAVSFTRYYPAEITWYDSFEVYDDLVKLFENANQNLFKIDSTLIEGNVSERTVCAALMVHLRKSLEATPFHAYYADVEYNQ